MTHLMIYGATGYPGRMAAALASAAGIPSRVAQPRKISIALYVSGAMSRASAISASQNLTTRTLARAAGAPRYRQRLQLTPLAAVETARRAMGGEAGLKPCNRVPRLG